MVIWKVLKKHSMIRALGFFLCASGGGGMGGAGAGVCVEKHEER